MNDLSFLVDEFQWFHQHPEPSFKEYQTVQHIEMILDRFGIDHQRIADTGILVRFNNELKDVPTIGIRADIDALPIQERSDVPYRSLCDGYMHACGHDAHITIGLGIAIRLQKIASSLPFKIILIFQPGEETSLGALKITNTHINDDCRFMLGFHADPTNPVGTLGISKGAVAAAVDRFVIDIDGIGCHGAHPDTGIDPIVAASALAQGLNTIVSRNIDPFHPALLSTTRISSGNTWNVIPSNAQLEGTIRTLDQNDRLKVDRRIHDLVDGHAKAYQCHGKVKIIAGPPAVINDPILVKHCCHQAILDGYSVVEEERSMGGDDFSFYLDKSKGIYIKFGIGIGSAIHHDDFKVDQACLLPFIDYMVHCLQSIEPLF